MKYGYFDNGNKEYVITRPDVPAPWTNYLGTEKFCTVISQNAGGYSFYKSPEYNRVTKFRPNATFDRPGHYVYLRDDATGDYWSISWQPVAKSLDEAKYEVRHGLSYSKFACEYNGISAQKTLFVPIGEDAEIWDVVLKNTTDEVRTISAFSFVEFSFSHIQSDNQNHQMSLYSAGTSYQNGVIEYDLYYNTNTKEGYYYLASSFDPDSYDGQRDTFIGAYRDESNPIAVENGRCSNHVQTCYNHCGSLHKQFTLQPGEEVRFNYILGIGKNEGQRLRQKYQDSAVVDAAFAEIKHHWESRCNKFKVTSPNEGLDTMINAWTLYQAETCVVWSRFASFIEVGGRTGLGYRDTAQDAISVPHSNPVMTRKRLVDLLRGQVKAGYGLHLFDPDWFDPEMADVEPSKSPTVVPTPSDADKIHGIDDTCSDDHLWLVPTICKYVTETGEESFLDEVIPYADGGDATVYDHMKAALDFSAEYVGQTGICKGLRADWNDCLNLGGGESAMVSFLHFWALQEFIQLAKHQGKTADIEKYTEMAANVREACETHLWDDEGGWYIRGLTKNGDKIGTAQQTEGRIHLESNTLAVLSGMASQDRGEQAMDAVDENLYSDYGLHLNAPSFSTPNDDIGFVTRVYQGVKENGAIFSHPNPWAWVAEAKLGRGDRAMKFYDALNPYNQNDMIETRMAEPYSYVQFIMGRDHQDHGRANHPWLTGTSGWAYFAVTNFILGIQTGFDGLTINPCIPTEWPGFEVTREWRGATYNINVTNPDHVSKGIKSIMINGQTVDGAIVPQAEGSVNTVTVVMG
ncbi:N,N'-diacetylchitobiose phosphorylase [Photobacterium phosphoreum]|uniref:N,N'-diacetylchitobiose phosphorylase n=2 Tax=Photobacterium phosphoreum TaxID=659 RepID=A0AAW4ZWD4_PHOPO|nr:N,N'-diacetylchitobiose phosphorylase [Photobacterium phosphoreum]KJF88084.1 N,N'-diacetylchitobiose phosphorylase [Photobacterium phosphoreum]MCD9463882.1 N,N'-diacetylchitobiose phosphorylase [Photobacterium phosphoreum]MCD9471200.1 N,N'-diacetylchitobiose phosphorylase [Photobacterium phosphoreum]MCD9474877.1 N,N'-diacetylchitobiose phosphorylase [Photobacterium phosphoreum]MCD9479509.1 N,N'-diacetylchitobiose phosphorylase [Photobacterium phosphoreum]